MSDTEGMVRLMENAAEHLRVGAEGIRGLRSPNTAELVEYTRAIAAMAYGRGVLQMVAASASPESRTHVEELTDRVLTGYSTWADENDGVTMTDGELTSLVKFLRSTLEDPS